MSSSLNQRVIVGMSGGVDSSVAAMLLLRRGYHVEGLFMKNWEEDDTEDYCAAEQDLEVAQSVCDRLGIALHKVNFSYEYWERVFKHFLSEYQAGRTPNPDILCNKEIKFKAFLDYALELGANLIATGHYAKSECKKDQWSLYEGDDKSKDQSYFLYTLGQKELSFALFPLGNLLKHEVRQAAFAAGLPNHSKKDSTGICFIGERRFQDFLARFLPAKPGDIITAEGEIVGRHQGLMFYTLGQRQGLGIGGRPDSSGAPWYVADKDLRHNKLIVVQGLHHPRLYHHGLHAEQLCWIHEQIPKTPLKCGARTRYRQTVQSCRIERILDGTARIVFDRPQRAITPGQSVVFYQKDLCLGGGTITDSFNHSKDNALLTQQ